MKLQRLLAASLMLAATAPALSAGDLPPRQVTVTGESRIQVAPELATITLGVSEEASEAAAAMSAVSDAMSDVIADLKLAGIQPKDMQTQSIAMHPVWSQSRYDDGQNRRKITGFEASNTLVVRVRDLDRLGALMDEVLSAGANRFQGLSFAVADPAAVQDKIRGDAVRDAMRKARQLADAAEMELGPVRSISEHGGGGGQPKMMREMAMSADAMPVEAGELNFTHGVTVVFDLIAPEAE